MKDLLSRIKTVLTKVEFLAEHAVNADLGMDEYELTHELVDLVRDNNKEPLRNKLRIIKNEND